MSKYAPIALLDYIDQDALYDQFSDPSNTMEKMAKFYGVAVGALYARLRSNDDSYTHAQAIRARRLHELAIDILFQEPERIIDAAGNDRIDPASVALLKMRSSECSRLAGILDQRLSERHQIDVTHSASPLADFIEGIAKKGSTIAIASDDEIEDVEPLPD